MKLQSLPSKTLQAGQITSAGVALLYAAFAALWIVVSGHFLTITVADPVLMGRIELFKGLAFVAVTSGLLYLLLRVRDATGIRDTAGSPIGGRRLLLIFAALALMVPLIGLAVTRLYGAQIEREAYANLEAIARLKAEQIENWLDERRGNSEVLAGDDAFVARVGQFVQHEQDTKLSKLILGHFEHLNSNSHYTKILLLNTSGRVLLSAGEDVTPEPVLPSLWQQALSSKQVQQRDMYLDEAGDIHLEWAVPLVISEARGNRAIAIVVLRITAQNFIFPLIQTWPTASASGETLLVRREGESVLFLNELSHLKETALRLKLPLTETERPAVIAVLSDKPGTMQGKDYRNEQVLAAYRPVTGTDWRIIAKLDRVEVLEPLWDLVLLVSLIALAAIAAVGTAVLLMWRQQQRTHQVEMRARSMAAIEESERRYRAVTQTANDAIVISDSAGNVVEWNASAAHMFGYTDAEIIGQSLARLMPERYRDDSIIGLLSMASGGEPGIIGKTIEVDGLRKDGSEFPLELSLAQWQTANGLFFSATIRDITERKRMTMAVEENETRLRTLVGTIPDLIWLKDTEGIYLSCNPMFERFFGAKEADIVGKTDYDFVDKEQADFFRKHDRIAMAAGKPSVNEEWVVFADDGHRALLEAVKTPMKDANGNLIGVLGIARDITERKAAETKIQRLTQLYAALSQCNEAIVRSADMDELFPQVCRSAVEFGGMKMAWIGMIDVTSKLVTPVVSCGEDTEYLDSIRISAEDDDPYSSGPVGKAIRTNQPQWLQDFQHDMFDTPWHEQVARYRWGSAASLPLLRNGVVIGAFTLYASETNAFDENARVLLVEMARDISFALDGFDREAKRKQAELELAASEQHFRSLFENMLEGYAYCKMLFRDGVAEEFVYLKVNHAFETLTGLKDVAGKSASEAIPGLRESNPELFEIYGRVAMNGRPEQFEMYVAALRRWFTISVYCPEPEHFVAIFDNVTARKQSEQVLADSEQRFRSLVEQSIAGIYIIQEGKLVYANPRYIEIFGYASASELIGINPLLLVAEPERDTVANLRSRIENEVRSLSYGFTGVRKDGSLFDIGAHGARATYNGRTAIIGLLQDVSEKKRDEDQIQRYVTQLESAFMNTIEVATSLVEMRDPYTAGHEKRVAQIAAAIGTAMGLDSHTVEGLRVGGYIHDIGKIIVPAEILSKPGRLTAAEYELMKGHPQAGYDILKNVDFPWPVADIAYQHHERMDGSGYPHGLKGEEILLEARITAVADVVEAMASHRPYRPGLGLEKALAEIERGSGTIYDPVIAGVCLRLFREQGYELPAL